MNVEIKIPSMGESVIEVTIGAILKPSGSLVQAGDELLELETEKVNQVLSAPTSGKLQLNVKTGDHLQVGATVGTIEQAQGAPVERTQSALVEKALPPARQSVESAMAERLAPKKEAEKPVQQKETGERREKMSRLRKVIAEKLVKVKNETAMLTTFNEVNLSAVMAVREKEQENFQKRHGVKLGFSSFFIKATLAALEEFPAIGARIEGDEIVFPAKAHIGVAVSTEKGLMVPVIRDPASLSFAEIEKQLKSYAEQARNGTLSLDAMQGGTFTITNGGVFGSLLSTPILNPPQSGILGMHAIVKRPIAVDDQVVIAPMMYLALSYDHRIVDGRESIQFLLHIKNSLEEPARLLLDL